MDTRRWEPNKLLIAGLVFCQDPDTPHERYYWNDLALQIARELCADEFILED